MPDLDRKEIELTEADKRNAFSKVKLFGDVIMKKLHKMQTTEKNCQETMAALKVATIRNLKTHKRSTSKRNLLLNTKY